MFGIGSFKKDPEPIRGGVASWARSGDMKAPLPTASKGSVLAYNAHASMPKMFSAINTSGTSIEKVSFSEETTMPPQPEAENNSSPGPYCHTEERVVYEDKCEEYVEETCHSQTREKCHPEPVQRCRAVIRERVEEECVNVTDKVCSLVETENKETVHEVFIKQKCHMVMEKVCDTRQELVVTDVEKVQCVDLLTSNCTEESVIVNDTTCTETVEFNCQQGKMKDGEVICGKTPVSNCINTPKQVTVSSCKPITTTLCYTLTNDQATPFRIENCHDQPTYVCRLEEMARPVVRRSYSYVISCNSVERQACKLMEKKKLEPVCQVENRPVCDHQLGEEKCEEEKKQFCYKNAKVAEVEVCDDHFQTYQL